MKTFGKSFLIGVLLTLAGTPAYAQDAGFIAKSNRFSPKNPFKPKPSPNRRKPPASPSTQTLRRSIFRNKASARPTLR